MSSTTKGIRFDFDSHVIELPPILSDAAGRSVKQDIHVFLRYLDQKHREKNSTSLYTLEVSRAISNTLENFLLKESEQQRREKFEAFITPALKKITEEIEELIEKYFNKVYRNSFEHWHEEGLDNLKEPFLKFQHKLKNLVQIEFNLAQNLFSIDTDYRHGPDIEELKQLSVFSNKTQEEIYRFLVMSLVSHCHLNFGERLSRNLHAEIDRERCEISKSYNIIFLSEKESIPADTITDNTIYFKVEGNRLAIYRSGIPKKSIPACKVFIVQKDENGIKKTVDIPLADLSQEYIEKIKMHLLKEAGIEFDTKRKMLIENTRHVVSRYVINGLGQALMSSVLVKSSADYNPKIHQQLVIILDKSTAECYNKLRNELKNLEIKIEPRSFIDRLFTFFKDDTTIDTEIKQMLDQIKNEIEALQSAFSSETFIPILINVHTLAAKIQLDCMDKKNADIISAILTAIINSAVWKATVVPMFGNRHDLRDLCIKLCALIKEDNHPDQNVVAFKAILLEILEKNCVKRNGNNIAIELEALYGSLTQVFQHALKFQCHYSDNTLPPIINTILTNIQTNSSYKLLQRHQFELEAKVPYNSRALL